jgi:flagellar protein FlgJ
MSDFIGSSEIAARTEMLGMNNQLQNAQLQAQKTESKKDPKFLAKVKSTSIEFESIFLGYMMKQMKKTVPEDALFPNSPAKDIFEDMHYDNIAKELAKAGGIGLASILYNQISKLDAGEQQKPKIG